MIEILINLDKHKMRKAGWPKTLDLCFLRFYGILNSSDEWEHSSVFLLWELHAHIGDIIRFADDFFINAISTQQTGDIILSRQIQLRRGSATEHESFVGAAGEVTMDTTNQTLRVHDGQTPGGVALARADDVPDGFSVPDNYDFVVDSQAPTAENGYIWFRKYKSGWVEQGGQTKQTAITLPVEMMNSTYHILMTGTCVSANNNVYVCGFRDVTTTGFLAQCNVLNSSNLSANANTSLKVWTVYGFCAQ